MAIIGYPATISSGMIAALEAANISVSRAPEGLLVSDAVAAQALIDSYAGSAAELSHRKAEMLDQLATLYVGKYVAGRIYQGVIYQIDPASQSNIDAKATTALGVINNTPLALPWPANFHWIAADNSLTPMDAAQMYAFAQDVGAYVTGLVLNNAALKKAIRDAADTATLNAVDINAGWPSNP